MFVSIVTVPYLVGKAVGMPDRVLAFFVSMGLVASGISTFIQVRRFGPVGSGLLSVQGTSFSFLQVFTAAVKTGGLPLALGTSLVTAPVEALVSRFSFHARRIFPPVVTGSVVLLIGLTLIRVGAANLAGGFGSADFGSAQNLLLGLFVMAVILVLSVSRRPMVRSLAIIIGILIGYSVAAFLGMINFSAFRGSFAGGFFTVPIPLRFGLRFGWDYVFPFAVIYLVTTVETIGDITATSEVSGEPVSGEVYERRLAGGILADSLNSMLAAILNSPPNTTFSQNNGIIQLTGTASRRVGYHVAVLLVLLGLCPPVAAFVTTIPNCVIGGATVVLFGIIAAAGIRILLGTKLTHRDMLVIAGALGTGLGVSFFPEIFDHLPDFARNLFSSGIATGGSVAILLNLVFPGGEFRGRKKRGEAEISAESLQGEL
ncbi:MAG: purine permease [Candidatus Hydrogenedentota bacterium]|nr:MAG: purine permease [Candidatus Hydrogenedentota bacterium]